VQETEKKKTPVNYLCLTIEGWHSGMIGTYGNSWIQTPALDALAAQSAVFDRFYAETPEISAGLAAFRSILNVPEAADCRKILFTDHAEIFPAGYAGWFGDIHPIKPVKGGTGKYPVSGIPLQRRELPAETIEGTQLFRNFAMLTDFLRENRRRPFFLWGHFQGFCGNWDFPMPYRKMYQAEEDPAPYAETAVPNFCNSPPEPDLIQSVMESYSGGMTMLDEILAGLSESLKQFGLEENTVLMLASVRGFSLGEHRKIGITHDLYGENIHLPLLIRRPDGPQYAGFRSRSLLQPADIVSLLRTGTDLPEEPAERHDALSVSGLTGESALLTPDWFLCKKHAGCELYVKPDDRWETNNVYDRCRYAIDGLTALEM
jgi:arylsulfatase A-like enzyme